MEEKFTAHKRKIERDGVTLEMETRPDQLTGPPWKEWDGHGPVSEWRSLGSQTIGERLLVQDRGSGCFYDYDAAVEAALRDDWDTAPFTAAFPGEQPIRKAMRAAEADFEYLRGWCNDEWCWVGVVVTAHKAGIELGAAALWGIESEDAAHILNTANDLIADALAEAKDTLTKLAA